MENKTILSIIALGVVAFLGAGLVFAHQGDSNTPGLNYPGEMHSAMEKSFENLDYNAWEQLISGMDMHGRMMDFVNENNFETFAEMHEAMEDGNLELAQELRTELGLGQGMMNENSRGFESMMNQRQDKMNSEQMMSECSYSH